MMQDMDTKKAPRTDGGQGLGKKKTTFVSTVNLEGKMMSRGQKM